LNNEVNDWLDGFYELNPEARPIKEEKKTIYLVDMFRESLPALDLCDKDFYNRKTPEQKKEIEKSMWILMRFMSSSKNHPEHHLMMVNSLVNSDFNLLVRKAQSNKEGHPGLQWKLLALCGSGTKQFHEKIPAPKGIKKNKIEQAILERYPLLRDDELELLLQINSTEDLEVFFKENGYDDKTIKELLKSDGKGK
jgi:hypothetical protein